MIVMLSIMDLEDRNLYCLSLINSFKIDSMLNPVDLLCRIDVSVIKSIRWNGKRK